MIELPEVKTIARQLNEELVGKRIVSVSIAEDHPKFMFLNSKLEEYPQRLVDRRIVEVNGEGKWIFSQLDSGNIFLLGEMFGRIRYLAPDEPLPKKVHATVTFDDEGRLIVTIQAWGDFQVLTSTELANHPYAGNRGLSPTDEHFTLEHFNRILDEREDWNKKPVKAFLVHEGNVAGIGNGYLQDILFRAKLSPKRKAPEINEDERECLFQAIIKTMNEAIAQNGRDTEKDLYGNPGGYIPILDRRTKGNPCPECGTPVEKIQYLGGSCYICPLCQT